MNKLFRNKKILLSGFFPEISFESSDFEKYKEARGLFIEDPWDRVKSIFSKDECEDLHPELYYAIQMTQLGAFVGAMFGATIESKKALENFIRANDTNIFVNKREVYSSLTNKNLLAMSKGALKWAPKFAIFFGGFTLISSCCELYRNKHNVIDNTIAGFSVGALIKFSFGIKGMLSAGVVGGLLGTVYGVIFSGLQKATKTDHLKLKYAQFAYSKYRKQLKNQSRSSKDEFNESLEKSGLYVSHISDPLNALEIEEDPTEKKKEIKLDK